LALGADDVLHYVVPDGLSVPLHLQLEQTFQKGEKCGPNALFLLLRFCGIKAIYEDVLSKVPLTKKGASLDSLVIAARSYGLQCDARKLSPDDLKRIDFPVIIHVAAWASPSTPEQKDHYLVLTGRLTDGKYRSVDPTSGTAPILSDDFMARNFTGYSIVVKPRMRFSATLVLALVLGIVMNICLSMADRLRKD